MYLLPDFSYSLQALLWKKPQDRIAKAKDGIEAGSKVRILTSVPDPFS
jgi:hypothetical protein